ncbi:hypothetical protein DM01DRAFT_1407576 [Hesseltinella vesiculosa]|uniref:Uncharacterized protein n=1 Tax=Hesseltinella vesiculosa TaxID=101127 RepID=A0A1X2GHN8_9FUNG|nr:hypothetical protein DM01DRAFT_1407576 [Hesseltinella vesiculosa]
MLKVPRLWKSSKTSPEEDAKTTAPTPPPKTMLPIVKKKLPLASPMSSVPTISLGAGNKKEIYELSTVNDSGVYLPPSTNTKEQPSWAEEQDPNHVFYMPTLDCLTTGPHSFYTPSSTLCITA